MADDKDTDERAASPALSAISVDSLSSSDSSADLTFGSQEEDIDLSAGLTIDSTATTQPYHSDHYQEHRRRPHSVDSVSSEDFMSGPASVSVHHHDEDLFDGISSSEEEPEEYSYDMSNYASYHPRDNDDFSKRPPKVVVLSRHSAGSALENSEVDKYSSHESTSVLPPRGRERRVSSPPPVEEMSNDSTNTSTEV